MAKSDEKSTGEPIDKWIERFKGENGGYRMLMKEYESIRAAATPPLCPAFQNNSALNRYNNIHLIDQSRVILNDGLQPDYIHANWVDGYRQRNSYILTQAPTDASIKDYWRMVWQERAQVIVCLTSLKEKGSVKAEQFYPSSTEAPFRAGPLRLILMGTKEFGDRRIQALFLKLYCWFGKSGRERDIILIFYGEWPDRAVPSDAGAFLDLLVAVENVRSLAWRTGKRPECGDPKDWKPPVVVNCSAGVGRSATFVACQIEVDRVRDTGTVDFQGTVRRLRSQRCGAVQNWVQYVFICRVVLEAARRYGVRKEGTGKSTSQRCA